MWFLLPAARRGAAIWLLIFIFVPLWLMAIKPQGTEHGIFSLQFAAFVEDRAGAIIEEWTVAGKVVEARDGLRWDFAFLVAYATLGGDWFACGRRHESMCQA